MHNNDQNKKGEINDHFKIYYTEPDIVDEKDFYVGAQSNNDIEKCMERDYTSKVNLKSKNELNETKNRNEVISDEVLKQQWRKEKNRIAAKKSREKKAYHIKELEKRERTLRINSMAYCESIHQYDQLLHLFISYAKELSTTTEKSPVKNHFINYLKQMKTKTGFFLTKIQPLTNAKILVTNELIEEILKELEENKFNEDL